MAHFGTFASRLRVSRRLSLKSLAARLDFSDSLQRLETFEATGEASPDFLDAVRNALRVSWQDWDEIADITKYLAHTPRRRKPVEVGASPLIRSLVIREFVKLFAELSRTHDTSHALIGRLVTHTGVYPRELCEISSSDFQTAKNRIEIDTVDGGEVIFGRVFSAVLNFHAENWAGEWLFVGAGGRKLTGRHVREIARRVAG